jgi:hypothetical protein
LNLFGWPPLSALTGNGALDIEQCTDPRQRLLRDCRPVRLRDVEEAAPHMCTARNLGDVCRATLHSFVKLGKARVAVGVNRQGTLTLYWTAPLGVDT